MSQAKPTRKQLLLMVALFVLVPIVVVFVVSLLIGVFLILTTSDYDTVPQDCPAWPLRISGTVRDSDSRPIEGAHIEVDQRSGDEVHRISLVADEVGRFTHEFSGFSLCDALTLTVSAEGFATQTVQYSLFDDYTEDTMPQSPEINFGFTLRSSK